MPEFNVVDLASQAEAIAQYTQGWSRSDFLAWLGQYGELIKVPDSLGYERYSFRARSGVVGTLWFTETGELELLGRIRNESYVVAVQLAL